MEGDIKIHSCGNATLIVEKDGRPIIATDPWLHMHTAYFGSWCTSHKIPIFHMDLLERSPYYWISHFHPDHLNLRSLLYLKAKEKTILLSQQYYNRVANDLRRAGIKVIILPSKKYINLDQDLEIATFPILDTIDSGLLIKSKNCLILNLNDTHCGPSNSFVKKEISNSKHSLLLKLAGYGDADMINIYNYDGKFIEPLAAARPAPGYLLTTQAKKIGCTHAMHFSSFHKYIRTDSNWANKYTTPENDLERGWDNKIGYFKQFSSLLMTSDGFQKIDSVYPEKNNLKLLSPNKFGDIWDQEPSSIDVKHITDYLKIISTINNNNDFLSIKVGSRIISYQNLNQGNLSKDNVILHAPKMSVIRAIKSNIFDDLLIGNFAKLILPRNNKINFNSCLKIASKYHDNAGIKTAEDLKQFISFHRGSYDSNYQLISNQLSQSARSFLLSRLSGKISLLKKLKNVYQKL